MALLKMVRSLTPACLMFSRLVAAIFDKLGAYLEDKTKFASRLRLIVLVRLLIRRPSRAHWRGLQTLR